MAAPKLQIVNRITVADVLRAAKQQRMWKAEDKEVKDKKHNAGDPRFNDDGTPDMGPLDKNRPQDLYVLIGRAREDKSGTTQYGDYKEYFGAFEAQRICDGVVFKAGRCILPPPTDTVVDNVYRTEKEADPNAEVAFAFIIGSEEHKHGDEVKFRYTCKPLTIGDQVQQDPLAAIKEAVAGQLAEILALPDYSGSKEGDKAPKGKK